MAAESVLTLAKVGRLAIEADALGCVHVSRRAIPAICLANRFQSDLDIVFSTFEAISGLLDRAVVRLGYRDAVGLGSLLVAHADGGGEVRVRCLEQRWLIVNFREPVSGFGLRYRLESVRWNISELSSTVPSFSSTFNRRLGIASDPVDTMFAGPGEWESRQSLAMNLSAVDAVALAERLVCVGLASKADQIELDSAVDSIPVRLEIGGEHAP